MIAAPGAGAIAVAHVAELWRYPVKSMGGEQVDTVDLLQDGIAGDRRFAVESSGAPWGKPLLTGRERAAMLLYSASTVDGAIFIHTPEGRRFSVDDPELLAAMEERLPQNHRLRMVHSEAPMTDCRPVAILSQETIAHLSPELGFDVDARRFRANIVLSFDGVPASEHAGFSFAEDRFVGHTLRIGSTAALRVTERDPRCRTVTLDPETAEANPNLMKHLDRHHGGRLGTYARTVIAGRLRVGDPVWLA